jgi:hypothetical protein
VALMGWLRNNRPNNVWRPSKPMIFTENSQAWLDNMDLVNEASLEARWDVAAHVVQIEISRQLDRIANALEAKK